MYLEYSISMAGNAIVSELLSGNNYKKWSVQMKTYLLREELWETVEADEPDFTTLGQIEINAWKKKNAGALHAIQISCAPVAFREIEETSSAKTAWIRLEKCCVWKPETIGIYATCNSLICTLFVSLELTIIIIKTKN